MLRILKSCIPQTYYKEHVHYRTYKKKKKYRSLTKPFRNDAIIRAVLVSFYSW